MASEAAPSPQELWVAPTDVADTGKFVQATSIALINGLRSLDSDVIRLLETWEGVSADAYRTAWSDTKRSCTTVLESLAAMAELLGVTSTRFAAADQLNARPISSLDLP